MNPEISGTTRPRASSLPALYRAIWRWHFYAGLIVVPFLLVLAVTGLIMVYGNSIESFFGKKYPVAPGGERLSIVAQSAAAQAAIPGGATRLYVSPPSDTRASVFLVSADEKDHVVSVDPHDGKILGTIVKELTAITGQWPVVFPVHPRTRKRMEDFGLLPKENSGMKLLGPVGYQESLALTRHARCVLTDSGGLQEESTYFRTPCLTLRPNTERPVTISIGSNKLTDVKHLREDLAKVLSGQPKIGSIPPLWDGKTAERILQALV